MPASEKHGSTSCPHCIPKPRQVYFYSPISHPICQSAYRPTAAAAVSNHAQVFQENNKKLPTHRTKWRKGRSPETFKLVEIQVAMVGQGEKVSGFVETCILKDINIANIL